MLCLRRLHSTVKFFDTTEPNALIDRIVLDALENSLVLLAGSTCEHNPLRAEDLDGDWNTMSACSNDVTIVRKQP